MFVVSLISTVHRIFCDEWCDLILWKLSDLLSRRSICVWLTFHAKVVEVTTDAWVVTCVGMDIGFFNVPNIVVVQ
jgi:hypothetical protein